MNENSFYFEDLEVDHAYELGPYQIDGAELLEFNQKWDRLPIHLDAAAAKAQGHRGIIGSGQYTLCIKQYFVNNTPWGEAVIGAIGFDELRFRNPIYADDRITATITCVEKRESRSKPDRGIAKFDMVLANQANEPVLTFTDIVMLKRRPG